MNIKKKKIRYVVYYTGVFEWGYVTIVWRKPKQKTMTFTEHEDAVKYATKFRFKWVANYVARSMERTSEGIRCFEVKQYPFVNVDNFPVDESLEK